MNAPSRGRTAREEVGLCYGCRWSRRVDSRRGSVFWLCELADRDASLVRYPRLPRLECSGYEREEPE